MATQLSHDLKYPNIRVFITPGRSGSTPLLNALTQPIGPDQPSNVRGINEPLSMEMRKVREGHKTGPTYDFFRAYEDPQLHPAIKAEPDKIFIIKTPTGSLFKNPEFQFFPTEDSVIRSKPIFLFRNPIDTWRSFKARSKKDLTAFIESYQKTYDLYASLKNKFKDVYCITYETLIQQPEITFQKICKKWSIPFHNEMVNWIVPFNNNPYIYFEKEQEKWVKRWSGWHQSLQSSSSLFNLTKAKKATDEQLPSEEKVTIQKTLMPLYKKIKSQELS